jgi:hypothetical protein
MNDNNTPTDLRLKVNSKSDSSKDNESRKELLWESREEDLIIQWKNNMKAQSKRHYEAGKKFKQLHEIITLPSIILPVIASGLTQLIQPYPYVSSGIMLTIGILTGLNGFYCPAIKKEKHFNHEALYSVLATEIEKELCKPKYMRIAADVYLEKISLKKNHLDSSAPVL